jgi:gliding motility-associated-like protein
VLPLPNYFGTLTVPVVVNDGEANSNTFPLQVVVNPVNDTPNFNQPAGVTILEDAAQQSIIITGITAGPLESETMTLDVISDNVNLIPKPLITPNYNGTAPTATIVFKPVPNQSGSATISITLVDGSGTPVVKTFTITVSPVNDPPTLSPIANVTVIEDLSLELSIPLTGISPGGGLPEATQTLQIIPSVVNQALLDAEPTWSITGTSGTLGLKLKPNASGSTQITVRLEDNGTPLAFINRSFTLVITPVNDDPVFTTIPPTTAEPGILYTYNVEVTDVDGDVLTLTAPTIPSWLTFVNGANGKATLSGTPPPGPGQDVDVLLQVVDAAGATKTQPFIITVNSRPVLTPIAAIVFEDTPYPFSSAHFSPGYFDAEGNPLAELEITATPNHGTLTLNNNPVNVGTKIAAADLGNLAYRPELNYNGLDTLRWNAADGFLLYSLADTYVAIEIKPVNDLPIATIPEMHDALTENDTLYYELGSEIPRLLIPQFEGSDPDGDNIISAEIRIQDDKYRSENEVLDFVPTSNVNGIFNENSGVLTLNGVASAAEYVEVIRSVTYNYENTRELILDTRNIFVTITDAHQGRSPEDFRPVELIYTFSDLDIPNAFTPNGDEANETWAITSANGISQYDEAEVKVYNKRGLLLFETRGFENQWNGVWNGEVLPSDTYFYTIELNYNRVRYKGTVTILR